MDATGPRSKCEIFLCIVLKLRTSHFKLGISFFFFLCVCACVCVKVIISIYVDGDVSLEYDNSIFSHSVSDFLCLSLFFSVAIMLKDDYFVRGAGLPGRFKAEKVEFHWGPSNGSEGSEHSINGRRYPVEVGTICEATKFFYGDVGVDHQWDFEEGSIASCKTPRHLSVKGDIPRYVI